MMSLILFSYLALYVDFTKVWSPMATCMPWYSRYIHHFAQHWYS
jgi:hypothetical protein